MSSHGVEEYWALGLSRHESFLQEGFDAPHLNPQTPAENLHFKNPMYTTTMYSLTKIIIIVIIPSSVVVVIIGVFSY